MKDDEIDDPLFAHLKVRPDGRAIHDTYLARVKAPGQKKPWDYYVIQSTIPADKAFKPLAKGNCPIVNPMTATIEAGSAAAGDHCPQVGDVRRPT
ncbi:hypothetical protein SAMN05443247_09452 [Bradyrhizobium erythrophlei]|nr:hypothetical protein SAMN05443247_09452 [Bradyrhizobium erythrophlei]